MLVVRAMPICSHELRLTGVCDVVEFVGILRAFKSMAVIVSTYLFLSSINGQAKNRRQRHFTVGCPGNVFGRDVGL